jgi:hypothetical protein
MNLSNKKQETLGEEMTREFESIYNSYNDPVERSRRIVKKNREEIVNEKVDDFGIY